MSARDRLTKAQLRAENDVLCEKFILAGRFMLHSGDLLEEANEHLRTFEEAYCRAVNLIDALYRRGSADAREIRRLRTATRASMLALKAARRANVRNNRLSRKFGASLERLPLSSTPDMKVRENQDAVKHLMSTGLTREEAWLQLKTKKKRPAS